MAGVVGLPVDGVARSPLLLDNIEAAVVLLLRVMTVF